MENLREKEVYRNTETRFQYRAPLSGENVSYFVTMTSPGGHTTTQAITEHVDGVIWIDVNFKHTLYDGKIKMDIQISRGEETFDIVEYLDVVTPLFTWEDLGSDYPANDVPELERLVRHVIEAYTGQSFGKTIERQVIDSGSNVLQFSQPLIEFRGISDRYVTHTTTLSPPKMPYEVFNDGYGLAIDWSNYDIKTDSMWILDRKCPKCYVIEGTFGYHYVPADVKQAALLIAGVWGCKQAVWRDRFIKTMRSTDWSVTYDDAAFDKWSTGSITADHLLSKYTRRYLPEVF